MEVRSLYLALVRPYMEEVDEPIGKILGAFSNHVKAENAIRMHYRKLASQKRGSTIQFLKDDDLSVAIRNNGEIKHFKGSILKMGLQ